MQVICELCEKKIEYQIDQWRCDCGGAWQIDERLIIKESYINKAEFSIWRYEKFFPAEVSNSYVSLGAGFTPLLTHTANGVNVWFKMDSQNPTGSFKDRGVELMMNFLCNRGVKRIVEDSSGNAGASVAAYAARLGIEAGIFAPSSASRAKLSQIKFYGADIHQIDGPRINATNAVLEAVEAGSIYASHAYNPLYLLGQQTAAYEVWEQFGFDYPEYIVVPVGQGGNLLGYYLGFLQLLNADLIDQLPRLIAVQPEHFSPICKAYDENWKIWEEDQIQVKKSIADGLAIIKPVRWKQILKAVKTSNGFCVRVSEDKIRSAHSKLAKIGFFIEPTSAVVYAGYLKIRDRFNPQDRIVLSLTGHGLKTQISM